MEAVFSKYYHFLMSYIHIASEYIYNIWYFYSGFQFLRGFNIHVYFQMIKRNHTMHCSSLINTQHQKSLLFVTIIMHLHLCFSYDSRVHNHLFLASFRFGGCYITLFWLHIYFQMTNLSFQCCSLINMQRRQSLLFIINCYTPSSILISWFKGLQLFISSVIPFVL